ncbi:MAG: hypothetical protein AABY10_04115, partial [Nanoarchaeota archaeon]
MTSENKYELRDVFLRTFVKEVIMNSYKPSEKDLKEINLLKELRKKMILERKSIGGIKTQVETYDDVETKIVHPQLQRQELKSLISPLRRNVLRPRPLIPQMTRQNMQMPAMSNPMLQQPFGAKAVQGPALNLGKMAVVV